VVKRGYPFKEVCFEDESQSLEAYGFKNNENLMVSVDLTKLPKLEVDQDVL
jgi:hypothetical protein